MSLWWAKASPSRIWSTMRQLLVEGEGSPRGDGLLEVRALQQLHGHVDLAVLLAVVVDGDDVRVVQAGRGLGLALEALAQRVVGAELGGDRLDRHEAVQDRVVGLVDLAHRALTDLFKDLVLPDLLEHGRARS